MALKCLAAQVRGAPPPLNSDAQAALDAALGRSTPVCFLLPGGVPDDDVGRERERGKQTLGRELHDLRRKTEGRREVRKQTSILLCMMTGNGNMI